MSALRATLSGTEAGGARPALRPQSLMLALLGEYVMDRGLLVCSGSYIEVLGRAGVSEQATRSTLTRMVQRGLLYRQRSGRRMYFGLTPRSEALLRDGGRRVWVRGVVNTASETEWTLIGFSFPDAWKRQRHELRTRLTWAGFGLLHGGLWLAPGQADVESILDELGLRDHVKVFVARPKPPTDISQLVRDAYDLPAIARRYHDFLARWDPELADVATEDALASKLLLTADWLSTIREDPRLPLDLLPEDWPAAAAQRAFRTLHAELKRPADQTVARLLDTIPEDPRTRPVADPTGTTDATVMGEDDEDPMTDETV